MMRTGRYLRTLRRALPLLLLVAFAVVAFAGCDTDTPTNTFDSRGEVADQQRDLFYLAMWPAIVIMIGVLAASVIIVLRFRRRSDSDPIPEQVHGNTKLELTWTIAPAILLLALGIPTVLGISDLGRAPADDAFKVHVEGQRFQWLFTYPDILDADGQPVFTVDEVYVPVGDEIGFDITSIDVIHSFWVPKLAGKLDAIPGKTNTMWMRSDYAETFVGQCVEFCGQDHANMEFALIALEEDDFQAWQDEMTAGD